LPSISFLLFQTEMDPKVSSKAVKDGNWEFPEDIAFPVDVRVMVKMYKVAEIEGDA
jgi:hypothetical protein